MLSVFYVAFNSRPLSRFPLTRTKRGAISAKQVDTIDMDGYVPPVHKKTQEVLTHLKQVMQANVLFEHLERDELTAVMDAMYEVKVKGGENVITQGDEGDIFYIVSSGTSP